MAPLMDTLRHWTWVLTGACTFLLLVGVILFLMLRAAAWRR